MLDLSPRAPAAPEGVGRAGVAVGIDSGVRRADDGLVAADIHRVAEAVARNPAAGSQCGLLAPHIPAAGEDRRRAAVAVGRRRADQGGVGVNRHAAPELAAARQFGLLAPHGALAGEDVSGVAARRADDEGALVNIGGCAELRVGG